MPNTDNPEVDYDNLEQMIDEEAEDTTAAGEDEEEETPSDSDPDAEEEEETPADDEDDPRIPEKFKGKSAADIAEAYTNLESMMNQKAIEIAQKMMGGNNNANAKKAGEEMEDDDLGISEEELKKMTPKQFMQHMNKVVTERAKKIVTETMSQQNEVRTTVRTEIKQATKDHPHLKDNKEYRSVVVDMIDAAAGRGEKLTLREACKKADKAMGIKPGAAPAKPAAAPKKKVRTAVEKTDGPSGGNNASEEDEVKRGLLGSQSTSGLGGLGV